MKLIIIEGGDSLGKNAIIKSLCEYYDYDNISIRHFGKPPKGLSPKATLDFQFNVFNKEAYFVDSLREQLDNDEYGYYDNVVIWNRSHLGEFVYSQMFRGITERDIKGRIEKFEKLCGFNNSNTFLISLTAGAQFFLDQEDGESFSQNIEQKTKELKMFKIAHEISIIPNKKIIKVDRHKLNVYRDKDIIFGEVLELLNEGQSII